MLCRKPFRSGMREHGCGQCIPCRINRRNKWSSRLQFEALSHGVVSFLTLTYAEEHLPDGASLNYRHKTLFLKRLRKAIAPTVLRYYGAGEYGDKRSRPHFHILLYGYPHCSYGLSRYRYDGKVRTCCPPCDLIRNTWTDPKTWAPYGKIQLEAIREKGVFNYVCGYITKKLDKNNPLLMNRTPEKSFMSRRPGIGFDYVKSIGLAQMTPTGLEQMRRFGDVTPILRQARKTLILDRYMRNKLREEVGIEKWQVLGAMAEKDALEVLRLSSSLAGDRKEFEEYIRLKDVKEASREQLSKNAESKLRSKGL